MTNILITGGRGFLGRNLAAHLHERKDCIISVFDQDNSAKELQNKLIKADLVFHLAGVNRSDTLLDYERGNAELTEQLCRILRERRHVPKIVFSSSIQAGLNNPYGVSKAKAENTLQKFSAETGACVRVYRLKNLFGKWSRPNYNSVTATFCHNIANNLPIIVSDPARELELSYVDDVVTAFLTEIDGFQRTGRAETEIPAYKIQLGDLAARIQALHAINSALILPDFADWFNRALYATYLSFVPSANFEHSLTIKSDERGSLAEFIKQKHFGSIFVSRTKPGVTRGNHYHHTKTEKFMVVEGDGMIRMRAIQGGSIKEFSVTGSGYQVIDIPPGFTHAITNVGKGELVTLFWSSELFDPTMPDTCFLPVDDETPINFLPQEKA
jgi:UDP-2-acetamido-2,6-beta-L-arabino-hexul-4-ose reductase